MAKRWTPRGILSEEDLVQEASIATLRAAETFDPGRGMRWKDYALRRAYGAMQDAFRKIDHVPRLARARARKKAKRGGPAQEFAKIFSRDQAPISALKGDGKAISGEGALERDFWGWVERTAGPVLPLYFRDGYTLLEIGRKLGKSESRASQLLARGLRKLKRLAGRI